jgi:putative glutathione S-transferase
MGYLLDGHWHEEAPSNDASGRFVREASRFHRWVTPDGAAGPTGEGGFPAEAGR